MLKKLSIGIALLAIGFQGYSQTPQQQTHIYNSADYSKLKLNGNLPKEGNIIVLDETLRDSTPTLYGAPKSDACGCYVEPDASYLLALAPTDDGSSALINIPFNFCLYGTNYNSLYINNNGNVSFGTPYGTFSATGFPSASFVMVAPFWGDVDTRAGGGQVVYKIYPNAIYVNWDNTGYYNMHLDKRNTFQLILSDGTDTTIGVGNNVGFCYKDMQWTTGDASSGVGGFGGVPATVGANKGNGIDYIQFGRFDQPGTAYDGPVGLSDGVSWLDNQSFVFSTCVTTSNVQPIFVDFSPALANTSYDCGVTGDTVKICATGDTLIFSATVFDPNISDIVTLSVSTTSPVGYTLLSNVPGNPATITWQFVADPANYGFNIFEVTATDNGTPMLSTMAGFTIFVDTTGIGSFNTTISGDTTICTGEVTTLSVPNTFDEYDWSTGSAVNTSGNISEGGDYFVTLVKNGCYKSFMQQVIEYPNPVPVITGPTALCPDPTPTLYTSDFYDTYSWTMGGPVLSTVDSVTISTTGTVTVTVTDSNSCTGSSSVVITPGITVNITGGTTACSGTPINLAATGSDPLGSYAWSNGDTDSLTSVTTSGTYTVTFTDQFGCTATDNHTVNFTPTPNIHISTADSTQCVGMPITLTVSGTLAGGTILWSTGSSLPSINVSSGSTFSVTVNNMGCTDNDNIVVFFSNPLVNITGLTSGCSGDGPITLTATGNQPGTYLWSNADADNVTDVTTTGAYTVTFTDSIGCTATDVQNVTINETPDIYITTTDSVVCTGETIVLTLAGDDAGGTINWSVGGSGTSVNVTSGSSVTVTVNNAGCTDTDIIQVVFNNTPYVDITGSNTWCSNDPETITATASTAGTLLWSTGASAATIAPSNSGTYTVVFTDNNGCTATDVHIVTVYPSPTAAFSVNPPSPYVPEEIPVSVTFINESTIPSPGTIVSSAWDVDDTTVAVGLGTADQPHTFTYFGMHDITLVVVSADGCIDSLTQPYEIAPVLLMPNIFTPNGTGGNNILEIKNLMYYSPVMLNIFNRWGNPVLETSDYKNNWDGTKNGTDVAAGVYYYEMMLNSGKIYSGYIHITR